MSIAYTLLLNERSGHPPRETKGERESLAGVFTRVELDVLEAIDDGFDVSSVVLVLTWRKPL